MIAGGQLTAVRNALEKLFVCKFDPDLARVRDAEGLARLPEAERQEWQACWAEVDAAIARANQEVIKLAW